MSTTLGLQVPVIPFVERPCSVGTVPPAHIVNEVPNRNVGVMFGFTVTAKLAGKAHCPASGVNVYVPEFWLSTTAGLQLPVIPFTDVFGNTGTVPPAQIASDVPKLNVGGIFGLIVTENEYGSAHSPAVGVKV